MISIRPAAGIMMATTSSYAKKAIQGASSATRSAPTNTTTNAAVSKTTLHSNKSLHTATNNIIHSKPTLTGSSNPKTNPTNPTIPTLFTQNSKSMQTTKLNHKTYSTTKAKQSSPDPHQEASARIAQADTSIHKRPSGVDSLSQITPQQKYQNYGLALVLIGFCTSVYSYSISSVGKAEVNIDDLKEEASGALEAKEEQMRQRDMEDDLAQVDVSLMNVDTDEEERLMMEQASLSSGGNGEKKKRALWKKIVFFWKKD